MYSGVNETLKAEVDVMLDDRSEAINLFAFVLDNDAFPLEMK